tara:strand:+ start:9669 stop:10208 length:540 start_codon:yes stop_codon:yes gene_type:complete
MIFGFQFKVSAEYIEGDYMLLIDCDHSAVGSEGTTTGLIVESFSHGGNGPNPFWGPLTNTDVDASRITNSACTNMGARTIGGVVVFTGKNFPCPTQPSCEFAGFQIHAKGGNAFMIDRMRLYKGSTLIQTWGKDDGRAWCLSTEPGDDSGDWADLVDGCYSKIDFHIKSGTSTQPGKQV